MRKENFVYVIEMQYGSGKKWHIIDMSFNLRTAQLELNGWNKANPGDNFRIVKYYPREDACSSKK